MGDKAGNIMFVGCAGWGSISGVPPFANMAGTQLERYASVLPAVEINSSFYRAHRRATYERWAACVPYSFRFSAKLPRTITHGLRLAGIDTPLAQFKDEVAGLGSKLGCILVQLPPTLQLDVSVADGFFDKLRRAFPCMVACEARHSTWFGIEASALLKAHAVTRVVADPPLGQAGPHAPTTSATYMRLHGSPRVYYSSYADAYIRQVAGILTNQINNSHAAWLIFDNTGAGAALSNALASLNAIDTAL